MFSNGRFESFDMNEMQFSTTSLIARARCILFVVERECPGRCRPAPDVDALSLGQYASSLSHLFSIPPAVLSLPQWLQYRQPLSPQRVSSIGYRLLYLTTRKSSSPAWPSPQWVELGTTSTLNGAVDLDLDLLAPILSVPKTLMVGGRGERAAPRRRSPTLMVRSWRSGNQRWKSRRLSQVCVVQLFSLALVLMDVGSPHRQPNAHSNRDWSVDYTGQPCTHLRR